LDVAGNPVALILVVSAGPLARKFELRESRRDKHDGREKKRTANVQHDG
jgi:hypothetical protein